MMLIINREEFNSDNTENYNISNTVNYLRNSHRSYINEYIPELKNLINQLSDTEPARFADCNLLMMYFRDYQDEFLKHLNYEDSVIFPYIIKISPDKSPGKSDELMELVKQKSITGYMQHHDNLDEKLEDLKNLLIKYFKPFDNSKIVRRIIKILFEMEEDLIIHELIENKILFPKVQKIEAGIIEFKAN